MAKKMWIEGAKEKPTPDCLALTIFVVK